MVADLYRRAFARASEILGGEEHLARHLNVDLKRLSALALDPPVQILQFLAEVLRREMLRNYKRVPPRRAKLITGPAATKLRRNAHQRLPTRRARQKSNTP